MSNAERRPSTAPGQDQESLTDLFRRFGLDPDSIKETERQRSLERDRERDRPRRPAKPRPTPTAVEAKVHKALREFGGEVLGPRFALAVVALTDHRRLRPMTRLFFAMFLWTYQPGRVWMTTARRLGESVGLEARTCERATGELRAYGYLARYRRGWICPPIEMKLAPEKRVWTEQRAFKFVPDWETVNVPAARYLGLVRDP